MDKQLFNSRQLKLTIGYVVHKTKHSDRVLTIGSWLHFGEAIAAIAAQARVFLPAAPVRPAEC